MTQIRVAARITGLDFLKCVNSSAMTNAYATINIIIQKIAAGLVIISRLVGPLEPSAAMVTAGKSEDNSMVKNESVNLDNKCINPLFYCFKKKQLYIP